MKKLLCSTLLLGVVLSTALTGCGSSKGGENGEVLKLSMMNLKLMK